MSLGCSPKTAYVVGSWVACLWGACVFSSGLRKLLNLLQVGGGVEKMPDQIISCTSCAALARYEAFRKI